MLTQIRLDDYKVFPDGTSIELKPLTVLLGKNGSGKTAAARAPLFALGAAGQPESKSGMPLAVRGISFGSRASDLVRNAGPHGSFEVGLSFKVNTGSDHHLQWRVQLEQSLRDGQIARTELRQSGQSGSLADITSAALLAHMHLISTRSSLRPIFERREVEDLMVPDGSQVPYILHSSGDVLQRVSDWYESNLGVRLALDAEIRSFSLVTETVDGSNNLAYSAQGLQQVLPVLTYMALVGSDQSRVKSLVVEEPELHLHPAVHGAIADFAVNCVQRGGNSERQIILETHSENLVLRLRRRVATGELDPNDLQMLWFSKHGGVQEVRVAADGSVENWPTGVFSEDLKETRALVEAARASKP